MPKLKNSNATFLVENHQKRRKWDIFANFQTLCSFFIKLNLWNFLYSQNPRLGSQEMMNSIVKVFFIHFQTSESNWTSNWNALTTGWKFKWALSTNFKMFSNVKRKSNSITAKSWTDSPNLSRIDTRKESKTSKLFSV